MTPAAPQTIGEIVRSLLILVMDSASRSTPPDSFTIFISTPTPSTSKIVFQGRSRTTFFSSAQPSRISPQPITRLIRPTFNSNTTTQRIIRPSPARDKICLPENFSSRPCPAAVASGLSNFHPLK